MEITWETPLDDGGRSLTGYYIQHRPAAIGRDNPSYSCDGNENNKWIHITGADLKLMEVRTRSTHSAAWTSFNGNSVRLQSCPSKVNGVQNTKPNHAYMEVDFHLPFKFDELCSKTDGQNTCSTTDRGYTVSNDGTGDSDYCSWGHACVNVGTAMSGKSLSNVGNIGGKDCVGNPTTTNKGWVSVGTPTHLFRNQLVSESTTVFPKTNVLRMTSVQPCNANNRPFSEISNIDLYVRCAGKQNRSVVIDTTLHCSHNGPECGRVQDGNPSTSWDSASTATGVSSSPHIIVDVDHTRYIDRIEIGWLLSEGAPDSMTVSVSSDEAMGGWEILSSWYRDCAKESGTTFAINQRVRWIKLSVLAETTNSGASLNHLVVHGEEAFQRVPTQDKATKENNGRYYGMSPNTLYEIRAQASNAPADAYIPKEIATSVNKVSRTLTLGNEIVADNTLSEWDLLQNMPKGSYDLTIDLKAGATFAMCGWDNKADNTRDVGTTTITTSSRQVFAIDGGRVRNGVVKITLQNMKTDEVTSEITEDLVNKPTSTYSTELLDSNINCWSMTKSITVLLDADTTFNRVSMSYSTKGASNVVVGMTLSRREKEKDYALLFSSNTVDGALGVGGSSSNQVETGAHITDNKQLGLASIHRGITMSSWLKIDHINERWLDSKDLVIASVNGKTLDASKRSINNDDVFNSCDHAMQMGNTKSGAYTIRSGSSTNSKRYCEMEIAGGGWTLVGHQSSLNTKKIEMSEARANSNMPYDGDKYDTVEGTWVKNADYSIAYDASTGIGGHDELLFLTGNRQQHCAVRHDDVTTALSKEVILSDSCRGIYLRDSSSKDGAYWIQREDGETLLVHCHFPGSMGANHAIGGFTLYPISSPSNAIASVSDIFDACGARGGSLSPISIKSKRHWIVVKNYIERVMLSPGHSNMIVPIGRWLPTADRKGDILDLADGSRTLDFLHTVGYNGETIIDIQAKVGTNLGPQRWGSSCHEKFLVNPKAQSGVHILHDGTKVYCDMSTSGGGWQLVVRIGGNDQAHSNVKSAGISTNNNQVVMPQSTATQKYSDHKILSMLGNVETSLTKFECNEMHVYYSSCPFSSITSLHNDGGPCTVGYSSEIRARDKVGEYGNKGCEGAQGLGSHCSQNSSNFMTPTYCVRCNNGDFDDGKNSPYGCKSGVDQDGTQDGSYNHQGTVWIKTDPSSFTTSFQGTTEECIQKCLARTSCQGIVRNNETSADNQNGWCSMYSVGVQMIQSDHIDVHVVREGKVSFSKEDVNKLRFVGLRTNSAGSASLVSWIVSTPPTSVGLLCSTNDYMTGNDFESISSKSFPSDVPILSHGKNSGSASSGSSSSAGSGRSTTIQLPNADHVSPGAFWDATIQTDGVMTSANVMNHGHDCARPSSDVAFHNRVNGPDGFFSYNEHVNIITPCLRDYYNLYVKYDAGITMLGSSDKNIIMSKRQVQRIITVSAETLTLTPKPLGRARLYIDLGGSQKVTHVSIGM